MPRRLLVIAALACAAGLLWAAAAPAQPSEAPRAALPTEQACPIPLADNAPGPWSEQEIWAWDERLCLGRVADLSRRPGGESQDCDVSTAEDWPDDRILTPDFVRTVLFHTPFRHAYVQRGFRVRCARFPDRLDLSGGLFAHDIWLDGSLLDIEPRLYDLHVGGVLSFDGSRLVGGLAAHRLRVDGSLFVRGSAISEDFELLGARIGGILAANGSTFSGTFNADRLEVAGSVFLRDGAAFEDVDLPGARIGGNLDLRGSTFRHANLTAARLADDLMLGDSDSFAIWAEGGGLVLRNAAVGGLQDHPDAWDNLRGRLDLIGFDYARLGGLQGAAGESLADRPAAWLIEDWLGLQEGIEDRFLPQPFRQLADTLRRQGYPDKADAVIIAVNDHQRDAPTTPLLTKALLWVEWAVIGYGYRTWLPLVWMAGLIAVGTCVAGHGRGAMARTGRCYQLWFAVDRLIPLLTLDERHSRVRLTGWPRTYFHFHHILGFVFASLFVAGLTGLAR